MPSVFNHPLAFSQVVTHLLQCRQYQRRRMRPPEPPPPNSPLAIVAAGLSTNLDRLIGHNRLQQAELQLAAEFLNRKIMYLRLVRQTGTLVDEVGRLGTPVPEAQAAAASGS